MPASSLNQTRPRLPRLLIAVGVAVTAVLCGCAAVTVMDLRDKAWEQANIGAETLLESLTRTLARDFELYGLSLQAVAERLRNPILEGVSDEVRHLGLFDHAATASGYGAIFVLDAQGEAFLDSAFPIPRRLNGADRAYFLVQRERDVGLYVGRPWRTRVSGREMIPVSRRFTYADGAFAGVVVGAIELAHFETVFARLNRNLNLRITVLFEDGAGVPGGQAPAQYPSADPLDAGTVAALARSGHVALVAPAAGGETLHIARAVGTLPMRVVVSVPTRTIDAAWRGRAMAIIAIVGTLAIALLCLLRLLGRELQRRGAAEAELAVLVLTDALTGIPNRRHFDHDLSEMERSVPRDRIALAMIDVDRFKAFNDRYGHPAGDEVLRAVGAELALCATAAGASAYRIGGEEFAILLDGLDERGAADLARACRRRIEALALPHALNAGGVVTVSIGLMHAGRHPSATQAEWLKRADAALYEAKHGGRNQVRVSGDPEATAGPARGAHVRVTEGAREPAPNQAPRAFRAAR